LRKDYFPPGTTTLGFREPLIFDLGAPGRSGEDVPDCDVPEKDPRDLIPLNLIREESARLPEVSEPEVVRHFTRLSQWNFNIDSGFYPLGSCTMKYNPRVNEWAARVQGFADLHPYTPDHLVQGAIGLMFELEKMLGEISGMPGISLQPSAGAHGELACLMMIRACLTDRGNPRKKVLIPDTAHGTNPASSSLNGYDTVEIPSGPDGIIEPHAVSDAMDEDVAALMLTNPNTLGLFESNIHEIAKIVHDSGGFVFGDGANLNAIMGRVRPGDLGIDAMQFNLHKTFSTPHGGGGPGSGPVGVCAELEPYLPVPRPVRKDDGTFMLDSDRPKSIGRVRSFFGNFGVFVRAYAYILSLGPEGIRKVADMAVLNANYLLGLLKDHLLLPHGNGRCMHEFVLSDADLAAKTGVTTLDIAKRLMDYGFHPPTVYFPLVVKGALMIEPTETESPETIEEFARAMINIVSEAEKNPEGVHSAPKYTKVGRLDETRAARKPVLTADALKLMHG